MFAQRCVVVGIMLTTLGGCVALEVGPDRVYPVADDVTLVQTYERTAGFPPPGIGNEAARNDYVTERLFAMDFEYNQYFSRLTNQLSLGDASLDVAATALGAAGTAFSSVATKTALSAVNTVVAGTRTAIDKDVLVTNTIQILQSQMETSRNQVRARIIGNLQYCTMAEYTVWQALTDLEDYYRAGTLPGALEALAAAAGNNSQQSNNVKNGTTQTSTESANTIPSKTLNGGRVSALAQPAGSQATISKCQSQGLVTQSSMAAARAAAFTARRSSAQ